MEITSILFILFVLISVIIYYIVPVKGRWLVLLAASYFYYIYVNPPAVIFLLCSTLITFFAALRIGRINEEETDRAQARKRTKGILLAALILNLGILAVLKYSGFVILNINNLFSANLTVPQLLLPLGISYYTFQSTGYMLDVYWNRISAENNIAKYALFVSFFPQLVQGPIGRFSALSEQLFCGNRFLFENLKEGIIRIVWGCVKKMVIGDWAAVYRDAIFSDPDNLKGIAIFGVLFYCVELYGNFSGGIDIVIGVARLFGIRLDENFRQPFFSVSIADFWTRWHITLGAWMRDYVFYPLSGAGWMKRLGKSAKKRFGRKTGRLIPVCISNLLVFLIVGIWHGADWGNIGWGFYNGIIIAVSVLLTPVYESIKKKLGIRDASRGWKVFMILRTFALINISWYFDCADSFSQAFRMIGYSVTNFDLSQFMQISAGSLGKSYTPFALITIGAGVVLMFIISVIKEREKEPSSLLGRIHPCIQFAIIFALLLCIPLFGPMAQIRGFLYAQF